MASARYGVREEVRECAETFYRALSTKNLKAVDNVWAQVSYASAAGPVGEMQQGWNNVASYFRQRFQQLEGTKVTVKLVRTVVQAVGDVAWLTGTERRTMSTDARTWTEELRVTCIVQRIGSRWLIVSYHASEPSQEPVPSVAALLTS